MNTYLYALLAVLVAALATAITRFLPFWLFGGKREVPTWVRYLGAVLPSAVMAILVVYCLKNVNIFAGNHSLPELIAVCITAVLHLWRKNTLLSILGGTAAYMLLLRLVF